MASVRWIITVLGPIVACTFVGWLRRKVEGGMTREV